MRFVERDNATCGIAALEEKIEANAEERAGRALVDERAAKVNDGKGAWLEVPSPICRLFFYGSFSGLLEEPFTSRLPPSLGVRENGCLLPFLSLGRSVHKALQQLEAEL